MEALDEAELMLSLIDKTSELDDAYYKEFGKLIGEGYWHEIYWYVAEKKPFHVQYLMWILFDFSRFNTERELFKEYDQNKEACDDYYKNIR